MLVCDPLKRANLFSVILPYAHVIRSGLQGLSNHRVLNGFPGRRLKRSSIHRWEPRRTSALPPLLHYSGESPYELR